MQTIKSGALIAGLIAMVLVALPSTADAFLRLGVDARWQPLALESMTEGGESLSTSRQMESATVGARLLLGFDQFSFGPKVNFGRHTYANDELSYSQLDLNLHARVRMPSARFAFYTEGGPAVSLDVGGVGYTVALGMEVDLLGWPVVDLNLGVGLQYVNLPIGTGPSQVRVNHGLRGMLVVGFDFMLY